MLIAEGTVTTLLPPSGASIVDLLGLVSSETQGMREALLFLEISTARRNVRDKFREPSTVLSPVRRNTFLQSKSRASSARSYALA